MKKFHHIVTALVLGLCAPFLRAAPHRYDHVVIVIEENRTVGQIIGDLVNAPYINSLATNGVRIGRMFAITHPSQPNYIQFFSGASMGVVNDSLPPNFSTTPTSTYPFAAPNLGAEIIAAGFTFAGFCQQLEAAGATDWADFDPHTASGLDYRRRHNPWANWVAKVAPIPANQLPGSVNRAFTQFPTNFATLPTVSIVVPDLQHDMHDGSRKEGDAWLKTNLNAYAQWAKTNNSLLIVTWDEDDYNSVNQIPTIFYGAGLRDGAIVGGTWTLHNLLRTLEDMYGSSTHAGSAAQVRSIVGAFDEDPAVTNVVFQQGLNGYAAARDTHIWEETPTATNAATENLTADTDTSSTTSGSQEGQVLVRFDSIFGNGAGQVSSNAIIHSAKLILFTPTNSGFTSDDTFRAHRMIVDWSATATWNSLGAGVSADNVEAASTASFSLVPSVDGAPAIMDVTSDVELFRTGTPNRGWVIRASSGGAGDGWTTKSSEAPVQSQRPALEITYSLPTPYSIWALAKGLTGANNSPGADPDHDGAANMTEFAYNLNPLVADAKALAPSGTNGLPIARFLSGVSGGILEIEFLRRKGTNAVGLNYTAQFSDSFAAGWASGQSPTVTPLNADWDRVVVRDGVGGPNARRFGKVLLTFQP